MSRIVLAMSGGVDSSVAAHLLIEQGHEVIGVFMRHGQQSPVACAAEQGENSSLLPVISSRPDHKQGCCSASDAEDARRVADMLDIPFYALDLQREFGRIIDYFVDEYTNGRTPNPCVMCNNWIKFGKLFDYADSVGASHVATGHYARLESLANDQENPPALRRGIDGTKDQSYVLFGVEQRLLKRMLLPVGGFEKTEIRTIAAKLGFHTAKKRDSQEICFVTSGKHDEFIRALRNGDSESTAGEIITTDGQVVGTHPGIERYTIGQRKGLGVAMGDRRFVIRIDAERRQVVIGEKHDLERRNLTASQLNWLADPPAAPVRCLAQIRYNSPATEATAEIIGDGRLQIIFDQPRHGVAPGQAVVCYDGDRVLGGGWID